MPYHLVKNPGAYQCAIDACDVVKVGRSSLAHNAEIVMFDIVAKKDIGNQFQKRRLAGAVLSNKKDRV